MPLLAAADHALVLAVHKAERNAAARARRRRSTAVSWERHPWRRCCGCGRWISEAQTAGWSARFERRWCEPCALGVDVAQQIETEAADVGDVDPQRAAA